MPATISPEVEAFLRETRVAVLATVGRDGGAHAVPIWYRWDGGVAYLFTGRTTAKWRNIESNAQVALCIDHREPPYRAVILEGRAEPVPASDGRSLYDDVRAMAVAYYGTEAGERFAEGYREPSDRVVHFRIVPERVIEQRSD